MNQSQNYLNASCQGKNQWWRYSIGILLILFFYLILGAIVALVIFLINDRVSLTELSDSVLLNAKDSALPIPSIWQVQTPNSPIVDVVLSALMLAIVYYIFIGRSKTSQSS